MIEDIINILHKTGFPFEVKVRKKLTNLGIITTQSRYYVQTEKGEASRDTDLLGTLINKTYNTDNKEFYINLILRIVSEVKDDPECRKICFYELDNENPENLMLKIPNFLNNCYTLSYFLGGHKTLSEYFREFTDFSVSKEICIISQNNTSKGNEMVYNVSQDLAYVCEYLHKKSGRTFLEGQRSFPINACIPLIVTNSEVYKVELDASGDSVKVLPRNFFIYLSASKYLDKIPITTKDHMYLPILVSNLEGLSEISELIKKISNRFDEDVKKLVKRNDLVKSEYEDFIKNIYPKVK